MGKLRLGVIGMGSRAAHMCRLMCQIDPEVRVEAVADVLPGEAVRQQMRQRNVPGVDEVEVFPDVDALLAKGGDVEALMIGTPCHLHAPIAVKAATANLPLFLEKPVAISWDQLESLRDAYAGREHSVVASFPLRLTVHVQTAMQVIRSGRLGVVNQVQAVNNVPYGGVYYGQWYRDYEKTGGLWLQKATHDFDYINLLLGSAPVTITAMHSRLAYGGQMPPEHVCSKCDLTNTCPESPISLTARGDDGGTLNGIKPTPEADHACTFSSSIKHQDAGSAIVMYENGAHASYAQNFLSRRSAGLRGATVIGYDATLQFAWQQEKLRVIDHLRERVEEIQVRAASGGHGGGDEQLARNFIDVVRGRAESRAPLTDGLLSAAMCLAAREAAATGTAQSIPRFDHADVAPRRPIVKGGGQIEPPGRSQT